MMIKKFGALLLSAVLCIGIAVPAFAFEGDTAPVEQPVLPEVVEEDRQKPHTTLLGADYTERNAPDRRSPDEQFGNQ